MSNYTTNTPRQLKDLILRRLGAPVINIEVTEDQIYDCISRALELYGEYHYQGLNKNYYVLKVSDEQIKTGLFELDKQIFAVTRLIRTNSTLTLGMGGGTVYSWMSDFLQSIFGNNLSPGQCYSQNTLSGMGGNLQYYSQMMSGLNLMNDVLSPLPEYYFNSQNNQLQIYKNFVEDDVIVIEAYTKQFDKNLSQNPEYNKAGEHLILGGTEWNSFSQTSYQNPVKYGTDKVIQNVYQKSEEQQVFDNRWIKDYSTSLVKELWGQILSKHQGMSLPGGVQIDGNRLIQEAKEEITQLREELYSLQMPDLILWG